VAEKFSGQNYDAYIEVTRLAALRDAETMQRILPKMHGKTIGEFGCGTGLIVQQYTKNNAVVGFDNNRKSLKIAARNGLDPEYQDLEKPFISFQSSYFDLSICRVTLDIIVNAEQLLDEIIRLTKDDGYVFLEVYNSNNIREIFDKILNHTIVKARWFPDKNELNNPIVRSFSTTGFKAIVSSKGLEIVADHSAHGHFPIPLGKQLGQFYPPLFSAAITLLCKKAKSPR